MQRFLPFAVLAAVAPSVLADVNDFASQVAPNYRGAAGAEFLGFDNFTVAFGGPNAPDFAACGEGSLTGLDPMAFLTSTMNIYSPASAPSYRLDYIQDAALLEVSLQLRTLGNPLDSSSVRLVPIDENGVAGAPVLPDTIAPLGALPGELRFVWDLSLNGLTQSSFQILFEASQPNVSLDVALLDVLTDRGSLETSTDELSAGTGGTQGLAIDAGSHNAGNTYLVLGSRTGTAPGTPIDGVTVPLNFDGYTLNTISGANGGVFQDTLGVLDACGRADASVVVPAGLDPSLVGLTVHHAALVIDTVQFLTVFATDAAPLTIQF